MTRTVLVTGGTGLLGRQVLEAFELEGWRAVGTGLTRAHLPNIYSLDLLDKKAIEKLMDEIQPNVVIHCAAIRSPDDCAADSFRARALNAISPTNLATLTSSRNIFLLYISTDYVFSGRRDEAPYAATAPPNPANTYGQTKLEGETGVLQATDNAQDRVLGVVLRVPILYGSCPAGDPSESAVNTLVSQVWRAQSIKDQYTKVQMDHWAQRYPTNTTDVARVCVDISKLYTERASRDLPRILHFSSEDRYTKYEICQMLADILGLPLDGMEPSVPAEAREDGKGTIGTARPYDCHLDTSVLKELGIDTHTTNFKSWWRRELRAFKH